MRASRADAEREAERLLATAWGNKFPVDPVQIARDLGIDVVELELESNIAGAIYGTPGEDPTILLNATDSPNRQRFTCAHELGHYVMHAEEPDAVDYVDYRNALSVTGENSEEVFANAFAAALLMPAKEVRRLTKDHYTHSQLALYFGVSYDALSFRLENLGLTNPGHAA